MHRLVNHEHPVGEDFAFDEWHVFEFDAESVRFGVRIDLQLDTRRLNAEIGIQFRARLFCTRAELRGFNDLAKLRPDTCDDAAACLALLFGRNVGRTASSSGVDIGLALRFVALANEIAANQQRHGEEEKHRGRKARHERHARKDHRRQQQSALVMDKLSQHVVAEIVLFFRADARDHHTGATDTSSAGICATRPSPTVSSEYVWTASAERHAVLRHTDRQTADQVDEHDDQAGDGIALDELHRAVHGAVEMALALQHPAQAPRLGLGDVAGAQVAVDAHLLAGHGVEA